MKQTFVYGTFLLPKSGHYVVCQPPYNILYKHTDKTT